MGSKDKELFGLLKIPDEVIIKELRIEIGKLNSYISELEFKIKEKDKEAVELVDKVSKDPLKDINFDNISDNSKIKILESKISRQRDQLGILNKKIQELISESDSIVKRKCDKLIKENEKLKFTSSSLYKQNELLKKQIFELVKEKSVNKASEP